jgi:hypothetical protein
MHRLAGSDGVVIWVLGCRCKLSILLRSAYNSCDLPRWVSTVVNPKPFGDSPPSGLGLRAYRRRRLPLRRAFWLSARAKSQYRS